MKEERPTAFLVVQTLLVVRSLPVVARLRGVFLSHLSPVEVLTVGQFHFDEVAGFGRFNGMNASNGESHDLCPPTTDYLDRRHDTPGAWVKIPAWGVENQAF